VPDEEDEAKDSVMTEMENAFQLLEDDEDETKEEVCHIIHSIDQPTHTHTHTARRRRKER